MTSLFDERTSEADLQGAALDLASLTGKWLTHHTRPAQRRDGRWTTPIAGDAGFPDVVFASAYFQRIVFAEFKREKGRLRAGQVLWAKTLKAVTFEPFITYRLWRPSDWDEIERVLMTGKFERRANGKHR